MAIVKMFPAIWAILYVLELNWTHLHIMNVTSDFKALF